MIEPINQRPKRRIEGGAVVTGEIEASVNFDEVEKTRKKLDCTAFDFAGFLGVSILFFTQQMKQGGLSGATAMRFFLFEEILQMAENSGMTIEQIKKPDTGLDGHILLEMVRTIQGCQKLVDFFKRGQKIGKDWQHSTPSGRLFCMDESARTISQNKRE